MSESQLKVLRSQALLCAERGWPGTFTFRDGEVLAGAFITATDDENDVIVLERPGERHLKPRIVHLKDLEGLEPHWP